MDKRFSLWNSIFLETNVSIVIGNLDLEIFSGLKVYGSFLTFRIQEREMNEINIRMLILTFKLDAFVLIGFFNYKKCGIQIRAVEKFQYIF